MTVLVILFGALAFWGAVMLVTRFIADAILGEE